MVARSKLLKCGNVFGGAGDSPACIAVVMTFLHRRVGCMKFQLSCCACFCFILSVIAIAGCGPTAPYDVVLIAGSVYYDGKPIPKGFKLDFSPEDGRRGSVGVITDDAGRFSTVHSTSQDGVPTGKCVVNVSLIDSLNSKPPAEYAAMMNAYGFGAPGLPLEIKKKNTSLKIDFPKVD